MPSGENNDIRKKRATMKLDMVAVLIIGLAATGIVTILGAQAQDSPNSNSRQAEGPSFEQGLPPLNYRISADYGEVEVAKSTSSQSEDLFGSTMNVCAKINSKAPANGMAIGHNLYKKVSATMEKECNFERIGEYSGFKEVYSVYSVNTKQKRYILNPFRRSANNIFDSNLQNDTDNFLDINGSHNENSVTQSKDQYPQFNKIWPKTIESIYYARARFIKFSGLSVHCQTISYLVLWFSRILSES